MLVYVAVGQVFGIAIISTFMRISTKEVAASQFAIYMASSNLAFAGGALILGVLGDVATTTAILYGTGLAFVFVPILFEIAQRLSKSPPGLTAQG